MPRPKQRATSTWNNGQRQDLNPNLQPEGTYTRAKGFQLRFGQTGGMVLTPETKAYLAGYLPAGFTLIGGGRLPDTRTILFLATNNTASPNSLICILAGGVLTTIFDDKLDPNGERLFLPKAAHLQVKIEKETENITRVYFNDADNYPRSFTLSDYPGSGNAYTKKWSVHSFNNQPSVNWGRIYFDSWLAGGTLLSGHYRYAYRYRLGATLSSPFPLSTSVALRQSQLEEDTTKPVQMESSGVVTNCQMKVTLEQVDVRWQEVELLIAYSPDGDNWKDMVVADRKTITGATMSLNHVRDTGIGEIVLLSRLSDYDQVVDKAGTMEMHKHKLMLGNLRLSLPTAGPTTKATISAFVEDMPLDENLNPTTVVGLPIAYTFKKTTTLTSVAYTRQSGLAKTISTPTGFDYQDYKGAQVAHARVGYRRGESYPFAAVLFDRAGQPTFAWPLGTFNVPNYYDSISGTGSAPYGPTQSRIVSAVQGWTLERMGVRLDNIELPYAVLYDESGRLKVSGIAIVRGPASGRIVHQGICLPACWEFGGRNAVVTALPTFRNTFTDTPDANGFGLRREIPMYKGDAGVSFQHLQGWVTYHSPDLFVDGRIEEQPKEARLRLVGSVHGNDTQPEQATQLATESNLYVKAYRYRGDKIRSTMQARPEVGETTKIRYAWRTPLNQTLDKFYPEDLDRYYSPGVVLFSNKAEDVPIPPYRRRTYGLALQAEGSYLMKVDGLSLFDRGESLEKPAGYAIVNYEVNVESPSPINIAYQWTNHFQPINEAVLNDMLKSGEGTNRVWNLSGVQVWGGDTYLCRVDYARMIPFYNYSSDDIGGTLKIGFGHGMFFPIESKFNLALRYGRTYEKVGTMPTETATAGGYPTYQRGINRFQPEDWNINKGLRVTETIRHFNQVPDDTRLETSWPQGIAWSLLKTDGERFDSYRRMPFANLYLLEGEFGPVQGLVFQVNLGLYAIQDTAIARVPVDERQIVANQAGEPLKLADPTGREVGPADYLTTTTGAQRTRHIWQSPRAFYFFDARMKKWIRFSQAGLEPLSDRDGLHDFLLAQDLTNWSGAFDQRDDTVHLLGPTIRVSYNEALNVFVTTDSPYGTIWIEQNDQSLLVQDPATPTSLMVAGRVDPDLKLEFVVNPLPGQPKQFITGILTCSKSMYDKLVRIELQAGDTGYTLFPKFDERIQWKEGRVWFPLRLEEAEEPLRGSTMKVILTFDDNENPSGADNWLLKHETDYTIPFRP